MEDLTRTSFMLPRNILKKAKIQAANEGISLGEFIRKAIEARLPQIVRVSYGAETTRAVVAFEGKKAGRK